MRITRILIPCVLLALIAAWRLAGNAPVQPERHPATDSVPGVADEAQNTSLSAGLIASALPPTVAASPSPKTASELFAGLMRDSRGTWRAKWAGSVLVGLAGAQLVSESASPARAANVFLTRYGSLIGADAGGLSREAERRIGDNTQFIYTQTINSLPVFGSRVNLIFDSEGAIVYMTSSLAAPVTEPPAPVALAAASAIAATGLQEFRQRNGDAGANLSPAELQSHAALGYRLVNGTATLVYRFLFSIPESELGDMEIFVDAASGALLQVRSLTRK
jgi:hypothetical protein